MRMKITNVRFFGYKSFPERLQTHGSPFESRPYASSIPHVDFNQLVEARSNPLYQLNLPNRRRPIGPSRESISASHRGGCYPQIKAGETSESECKRRDNSGLRMHMSRI